jgi:Ca2+:H+ antiporter
LAAAAALAAAWGKAPIGLWVVGIGVVLVGAVFAAVHHAEIIALRVGEPFGTLVLALAVTVIEVALIGSLMLGGGPDAATLARDTVYATVMIVCNGVVGLCLVVGSLRHGLSTFRVEGASQALSVLIPLAVLALVLPNFTTSAAGPTYSASQIGFVGALTLALYAVFVFVQTVRHRDYFLPATDGAEDAHAAPPAVVTTVASLALLFVCLVGVVGLAKTLAPRIESAVAAAGAPVAVVGIAIALLVLLPETLSAVTAARAGRVQTSLNLALGSALATIGLTVPAIGLLAVLLDLPLALGLPAKEMTLLAVTLLVATVTLAGGRATVLHGAVHLVLFGAFLFLAVVP